jgi:hypothetical protein
MLWESPVELEGTEGEMDSGSARVSDSELCYLLKIPNTKPQHPRANPKL